MAGPGNVAKEGRFLFFSPARFGGYAFFRRMAGEILRPVGLPPGAPPGCYFETGAGNLIGLPQGPPAALYARLGTVLSPLGGVGTELSAAFRFWLRGRMEAGVAAPAAAAGIAGGGASGGTSARVEDPDGGLAGLLLAETTMALARMRGTAKGLLPLTEVIGREDADRIAAAGGGKIILE